MPSRHPEHETVNTGVDAGTDAPPRYPHLPGYRAPFDRVAPRFAAACTRSPVLLYSTLETDRTMQRAHHLSPGPSASAPSSAHDTSPASVARHTIEVGTLYFAAAYAALALGRGDDGVALFWPAAGVSAGLVFALGRKARLPVAIGTLLATIAVNFWFGRKGLLPVVFGLANAGEALAVTWLHGLLPGRRTPFRRLVRVLAVSATAAISCIVAAGVASLAIGAAGASSTSIGHVWLSWFLADFVGIAVVGPLVVAIADLVRSPPRGHDWTVDIALLLLFAFAAYSVLSVRPETGGWLTVAPGAALLPILIWISARAQPIVPALAVALLGVLMTYLAVMGEGRYGDARLSLEARILAAQFGLTVASVATWSIAALFMGQRRAYERLRVSERRLALIADAAPGVIFSLQRWPDGRLALPFISATSRDLLGLDAEQLSRDPEILLGRLEASDRASLLAALDNSDAEAGILRLELPLERSGRETWVEISARATREADASIVWHGFIQDVTARRRFVEELSHRTRNLLTVVQSVAEHTARTTPTNELGDKLGERLSGLAASHQLLAARGWEGAEIDALVRAQLAHFADLIGTRLEIEGPHLLLRPQAAQVIGMAVHELATNACKHGALGRDGAARLRWTDPRSDPAGRFRMTWRESGGPPYASGSRRGFGHMVTVEMPAYQLGAEIGLAAVEDGFEWRLSAPADRVVLSTQAASP